MNNMKLIDTERLKSFLTGIKDLFVTKTQYNGTVLYESDTPNFNDITLYDNVGNYKYLEVYAGTDDGHHLFLKVFDPDGKIINITGNLAGQSNFFIKCKAYLISGNKMTTAKIAGTGNDAGTQVDMAGFWGTHSPYAWYRGGEYIGIFKIMGFK